MPDALRQPSGTALLVIAAIIPAAATLEPVAAGTEGQTRAAPAATSPRALDAAFVKMSELPRKLLAGELFQVSITMKNIGSQAWGPEIPKHTVLRSRAPADNTTWGTHFIIQGQGTACKPGDEFTYRSWLRAPEVPGEYVFQWSVVRMDRGSYRGPATPFGEPTPRAVIRVQPRPEESATPPPTTKDPSEKQVLHFEDFEYAGSFRVPGRPGQDMPFSHSGLALRKMKDGTKRLFFNYTLPGMVLVELEIPPLVKLDARRNYAALKTARVKRDWGRLTVPLGGRKVAEHEDMKGIFANGGYWWDDGRQTLYWTWWHSYWCGGAPPILGASKLPEDGPAEHSGPWSVTGGNHKWYWGGVTVLSKAFADRYTGGRTLALGFGTGYSGTYSGSLGPSLGAIDRPDPTRASVTVTALLGYYKGAAAPRDGGYFLAGGSGWMGKQPASPAKGTCASSDLVRNAIFIETPRKHGLIVFYHLQMGRIGYDYGAVTSAGRVQWWYFYDPKDLGAVAQGSRKPHQVMPRSRTPVTLPGGVSLAALPISGSCFDADGNLLYVYGPLSKGCIHAFRLKDAP
ncbi:MAG: hypothetical protein ACYS5V_03685 [Planctomycetota bacterium]|jgi:hypothetical protein